MKKPGFFIVLVAGLTMVNCKENNQPVSCADISAATLAFEGKNLETVQTDIQGTWHLHQIDGGLRPPVSGPDLYRTKLVLTKTTLLWTRSDTVVYNGTINWNHDDAQNLWSMTNFNLTPYDILNGRLRFNWRDIEFDGIAYTFERECIDND